MPPPSGLGNSQRLTALTTQFSTCASFMLVLCMTDVNGPFNSTDNPTAARFHGSTGKLTCQTPLPALSPSAADGERVSETDRRRIWPKESRARTSGRRRARRSLCWSEAVSVDRIVGLDVDDLATLNASIDGVLRRDPKKPVG